MGAQTPRGEVWGYMENEGGRGMKDRKKPRSCEWGKQVVHRGVCSAAGEVWCPGPGGSWRTNSKDDQEINS